MKFTKRFEVCTVVDQPLGNRWSRCSLLNRQQSDSHLSRARSPLSRLGMSLNGRNGVGCVPQSLCGH